MENIEDTVVTSVLTDALRRYMRYLELEQELHESSQPRRGKDVQTDTDFTRADYFRARTVTAESCLQVVGRIAENVKRWTTGEEEVKDVSRGEEKEEKEVDFGVRDENLIDFNEENLFSVWEDEDDEPYINPITGQLITPVTSKSAGPSNTRGVYEEPSRKPSSAQVLKVGVAFLCRPSGDEAKSSKAGERLFPSTVEVRKASVLNIRVDLQRRVQPEDVSVVTQLNIIPNFLDLDDDDTSPCEVLLSEARLSATNPFFNPLPSRRSSTNTPGSNTPNTSSRDTNPEPEDTLFDFANERQRITNLQSEWALGDDGHHHNALQFAFPQGDAPAPCQFDLDRLAALKLQAQFDNEDQQSFSFRSQDVYAQQLEEGRTRLLDFNTGMEAAKELAREWEAQDGIDEQNLKSLEEKWAQEDRRLEEQAAFADAMRRDEEARDEAIRRDQAAAMAAQDQWEQEAREAEDSTRMLMEQMEREEEEEMERLRAAVEQAKALAEELERQEEEERQRLVAEAAEAERRERQADCVVCMETSDKVDMCLLSCEHYYCDECIVGRFLSFASHRRDSESDTCAQLHSQPLLPHGDLSHVAAATPFLPL
ncbi:hypothetical protein EG329_008578 [Mollisiaceae sp. DMI_Dod_QoI]|nr:hypothetical protein EG329_008578 [Helotiales sp. DMI_Dod_QoI]